MALFKIQQTTPALPIDMLIERLDSLLHALPQGPGSGVVESQSAYGASVATLPGDSSGGPAAAHRPVSVPAEAPSASDRFEREPTDDPSHDQDAWHRVIDFWKAIIPIAGITSLRSFQGIPKFARAGTAISPNQQNSLWVKYLMLIWHWI